MTDRFEQLLAFHRDAPDDDFTTYALAMECVASERFEEALEWLEKTLELTPDHAYAWYQRAGALDRLGRDEDARAAIQEGLAAAQRAGDAKAAEELRELAEELE